ncbi:Fe-S protein [Emcibacter sp.]|uniref:Fe-S protein n=1 Tax=Emcibacter sp. TaxID=1979954 RepID=UPI003A9026BD
MIFFSNKNRPFDLGPYALERLPRDPSKISAEQARLKGCRKPSRVVNDGTLSRAIEKYHALFRTFSERPPAESRAPLPDDPRRLVADMKGGGYFLDASHMGICELSDNCWVEGAEIRPHSHAIIVLVKYGRTPEEGTLARNWVAGNEHAAAALRACEIAACLAGQINVYGWAARVHDEAGEMDLDRLAVLAGLAVRQGDKIATPYFGENFALAAVTTDYGLTPDVPLADRALKTARGLGYYLGAGGAVPGIEWDRREKRASHMSIYPMEDVQRVEEPTTLILEDEVPRVPKRAAFFERALRGDLGDKAKKERGRFAFKQPLAWSMLGPIRDMVPLQEGDVAVRQDGVCPDAAENSRAVKSLAYFLGADLVGICEVPRYAWFSHKEDGREIMPYHKYAVVMLIDQGYETMEGASGDDYISGPQSMRAYMRGAAISGVMADHLRGLGFSARPQTNADSDVLHIPLILKAGLGELSRIGELVLNPFVGPRFKSVVLTTDLPLETDKPIDFGLQQFCRSCLKCARECPCDAIPWGDTVMFNGYEMWKIDAERCTRYRLTNQRGAACGRCMKTCPLNKVVTWEGDLLTRVASWLGIHAKPLKPLMAPVAAKMDDLLGHGSRNPVKKWWIDLEVVDGEAILPPKGVNERDLDVDRKLDPAKQKIAYYTADMMPPPDRYEDPFPVDRKAALAMAEKLETVAEARARKKRGGVKPAHYDPADPEKIRSDG